MNHSVPRSVSRSIARQLRFTTLKSCLLVSALCGISGQSAELMAAELTELWEGGNWRAVTQITLFDNQLWFTNSNPFRDANAADIYSMDLTSREVRFRRSLFSQDTGVTTVFDGHLYLPFEDPRRSTGRGEYVVTDGKKFQWHAFNQGRAFHVHTMQQCGDVLYAATGAYTGQLQKQNSANEWELVYKYPEGDASFSRIVSLHEFKNRCMFSAAARNDSRPKLLEYRNGNATEVPGWPSGDRTDHLTTFKDKLLAFNDIKNDRSLLSWNGKKVRSVKLPGGHPRGMSSDNKKLWLISDQKNGGILWSTTDLKKWKEEHRFTDKPVDLVVSGTSVFIGTWNKQGGGRLYQVSIGEPSNELPVETPAAKPLADLPVAKISAAEIKTRVERYMDRFTDPALQGGDFNALRKTLSALDQQEHPDVVEALSARVPSLGDTGSVQVFTGRNISRSKLINWYVIGAAARRGVAIIDPELVKIPFTRKPNSAQKYFETSVIAITATTWSKHRRDELITALVRRSATEVNDPEWLRHDIRSALHVLTQ